MSISLIDSHTHLDSEEFNEDRGEVIERARSAGVSAFVTIGAGGGAPFSSAENAIKLAKKYDYVWASAGVHPHQAGAELDVDRLRKLASHPRVVAIGETGLDFYRDWAPKEGQYIWFRAQVELALELKKPLIIHSREAAEECFKLLSEMNAAKVGGVFHCYSEDAPFAKRLESINFIISVPGVVTFKKSQKLRNDLKEIPLEQIMIETDAPYLAPEPYRGKRCESAYMIETARKIAEIKGISLEKFAEVVTGNTRRFFKI